MSKSRVIASYLFVIFGLSLLFGRYYFIQVVSHQKFLNKAVDNYSVTIATQPSRGTITDVNGVILAQNKLSYALAVLPKDIRKSQESVFDTLESMINLTSFDILKFNKRLKNSRSYDWVIIKDDLSNKEVATLVSQSYLMPTLNVFAHTKRVYPLQSLYAHSIGYVGKVSQSDKNKLESMGTVKNYLSDDYVGKNGLELFYESYLRGSIGKKVIQTDAYGNEVDLLDNTSAIDGDTLQLTINNKLQEKASKLLGDRKGAIVALDPNTGGVLAFVSKPAFDPNLFLDGISIDDWDELSNDSRNPLLNRCSLGAYPPGSTFKPFVGISALNQGTISASYYYNDRGYYTLPGSTHKFRNSGGSVWGSINVVDAIAHSSDTFFYNLGVMMGVDRMDSGLEMFGFGAKTGIDLPHETTGILPSRAWKANRFTKNKQLANWQLADSVNMGVGQGYNNYSPLQMAYATSIIANNGVVHKPHFINKIIHGESVVLDYSESSYRLPISKSHFDLVRLGMVRVMQIGTGKNVAAGARYTIAGKTGTAQVVGLDQTTRKAKKSGAQYQDHSWFIAFAPVESPQIAVAVIVENAGFGAKIAGPIVRQLLDGYILNKYEDEINESSPANRKMKSSDVNDEGIKVNEEDNEHENSEDLSDKDND